MRQFDVFRNPSPASRPFAPFVAAIQSHFVELETVLVAPLVTDKEQNGVDLVVEFREVGYTLSLSELGAVARGRLGRSRGTLADNEDDIRRALEKLFSGF